ncbi:hypothetical protein FISHEDRAFT_42041 [Fistulina hepatica ATCC 64428]|uniref:BSD domain-containing protein n=1 Tax=Fistulina hepatica ATCC 64428 TaxID=1128425 RepID=A0A0D7ADN4_9AGAR|nr:hypothetical protein FISHEDRAFT_42041 [Fistulina hepatica ATCC 64428]
MSNVCSAKASYKKAKGLLELSDTHLQWTADGMRAPSVRVALSDIPTIFCSKRDAPAVRLKIAVVNDPNGFNFTFSALQPVALAEREKFKKEITNAIALNRANVESALPLPPTLNAPGSSSSSRAVSVTNGTNGHSSSTPTIVGTDAATDFRLRKQVLLTNRDLAQLHRELVMSGQITEAEFWEGREHLLLASAAEQSQRKGKRGQLVDPRPETINGEVRIRVTPQLVHDIFDEYPVVQKAYNDIVPKTLSEAEFWTRYFGSKLFHAHRASVRSAATQHVANEDPIFDKYLEREDDGLEPRNPRDEVVELFVDLVATSEDHKETGNAQDYTMQAGRDRKNLPLIRKFNEHSERLLNSALGDLPQAKRRRLNPEDDDARIDLEDLHDADAASDIVLQMKDIQRHFQSSIREEKEQSTLDSKQVLEEAKSNATQWKAALTNLKVERQSCDAALLSMTHNVEARLRTYTKTNDIPDPLLRQMKTCQTAANEFLRQYWTSVYPPLHDKQLSTASPAQRCAKAEKMMSYIYKTPEKIKAIVDMASSYGVDTNRVQQAMAPVLNAANHAMADHRERHRKQSRISKRVADG